MVLAYSYPGNGRKGIAVSQRAVEQPMTPAQAVGLGTGPTGPNLLIYFDGPWTDGSRALVVDGKGQSGEYRLRHPEDHRTEVERDE